MEQGLAAHDVADRKQFAPTPVIDEHGELTAEFCKKLAAQILVGHCHSGGVGGIGGDVPRA